MPAEGPPFGGHPEDDPSVLADIEEIRDALDEGDVEEALRLAEAAAIEHPRSGDVALELAAARYEAGSVRGTLEAAERAYRLGVEDEALRQWYVAAAHHYLWEFATARSILEDLLRDDASFAEAWYLLAQVCEMQGDQIGARRGYASAFRLEPDRFGQPQRMDEARMHTAVRAAREELPERFQVLLDELAVVVEDLPSAELAQSEATDGDPIPPDVLGLFVGNDRLDHSVFNPVEHPGVIFLFQRNLERVCGDPQTLVEEIRTTLWHELAHYLGFEEEDMPGLGLE